MVVLNDGTVVGVPEKAVPNMISNFISIISNPTNFILTVYLEPEWIRCEGYTVIHVHVPPSAEVHDDDREIIKTNLVESYDLLMAYSRKHLPDNLEPNPKNPIIVAFFRNIGHSLCIYNMVIQ